MTRVLVVDDEPSILRALRINLSARSYDVSTAVDGATGLAAVARDRPDVIILDLGLPDMDGTEVIHGVRGWTSIPIIVLSAWGQESQKVAALDAGADDYVTKPFGMDELLARLRAAVRRASPAPDEPVVTTEDFTVDLAAKQVTRKDGDVVRLTPTEWQLLEVLVRNTGRLVTQKQLLREVWGPAYETESNYLRVYLAQLRRKLEPEPSRPRYLLTESGMGYRFKPLRIRREPAGALRATTGDPTRKVRLVTYVMPSAVAAELFQALGDVPGVTVVRNAVDAAGQHGVAFRMPLPAPDPAYEEIILNPHTYQFLGWAVPSKAGPAGRSVINQALVSGPRNPALDFHPPEIFGGEALRDLGGVR